MSEYQYYEFLAIDHPLTTKQMAELRTLSTRAEITPTRFANEYQWGDFKGDPAKLMRHYFDAHVYLACWGNFVFSLRLPIDMLNQETVSYFQAGDSLTFENTGKHWIITWALNEEGGDGFDIDADGWMAKLIPLRDELWRGDLRSLYIGWLAAVTSREIEEEESEPLVPPGLRKMTAAQTALAEFIGVDCDLLAGATAGSAEIDNDVAASNEQTRTWLATLPGDEVVDLLHILLTGQAAQAERKLKTRYADWQRGLRPKQETASRRTVAELWKLADCARQDREKAKTAARARKEARIRKEREHFLATLAADFDGAWKAASQRAEQGTGAAYDEVYRAIVDLSEAYAIKQSSGDFEKAMRRFMEDHARRPALVKRFLKAGLWREC